jgi:spore maturation protein CgeB
MDIVFLGLSITSSWGNGHATTYRGLIRELHRQGHKVTFLEKDVPWYASQRDLSDPPYCKTELYSDLEELRACFGNTVRDADAVIVGSFVPFGVEVGEWVSQTSRGVRAFYDIDTPVTLAKLGRGDFEYMSPALIPKFDLYLSFSGGATLLELERKYGSPKALPFYCSFDPELYYPLKLAPTWDLGYMGTYSDDRQPTLERLLLNPAARWSEGRFAVAGPQYPTSIRWPENLDRFEHLPPSAHRRFYNSQRFTLNVTRDDMIRAGFSPSVRLFEAAACGVPIISDYWKGLDTFFELGKEIVLASTAHEVLSLLQDLPDELRCEIGEAARKRVMQEHTASLRAYQLIDYLDNAKAKSKVGLL